MLDILFGQVIAGVNGSTVSLEAPDGQSHELGVALPGQDRFEVRTEIFEGAVVSGVWKTTILASPDAGSQITFIVVALYLLRDQCD